MKRGISLLAAMTLAISLAPTAQATEPTTTRPTTSPAVAASVPTPFADEVARTAADRKKCTVMCVQSTLAEIDEEVFFVNGDSDLLMFTGEQIILRDLDTKTTEQVRAYPGGIATDYIDAAISNDGDEVYFYTYNLSDGEGRVYRVDTVSLALTPVTPLSSRYAFSHPFLRGLMVAPDNSGYFLIHKMGSDNRLCQYDENGTEQACSVAFGSGTSSDIFSNTAGNLLFVMSDDDKRYAFDVNDNLAMTFETIDELTGRNINFEIGAQANDGSMFFLDRFSQGNMNKRTRIYRIHMDGYLMASVDIRGEFDTDSIATARNRGDETYVLGLGTNTRGSFNSFSTIYRLSDGNNGATLKITKSMKITPKNDPQLPDYITADSEGRYLLAYGDGIDTSVIPVGNRGSVFASTDSEYVYCPAQGWNVSWNYVNLAPGKTLTQYSVMYKGPGAKKWLDLLTLTANGLRSALLPREVEAGGDVKVVPKGIKLKSVQSTRLVQGPPPAPRPGDPQPAC